MRYVALIVCACALIPGCLPASGQASGSAHNLLIKRNLFAPLKKPSEQTAPQKVVLQSVKPPPLDDLVALRGTFWVESSPEKSIAIIETLQTRQAEPYRENAQVREDIRVVSIGNRQVVCEYCGEEFLLTEKGAKPVPLPADTPSFVLRMESVLHEIERETGSLTGLRAQAVVDGGKTIGYRLTGVETRGWLTGIGLREGDVITKINATAIDSPKAALTAYENILKYAMRKAVVRLLRDGKPQVLVLLLE